MSSNPIPPFVCSTPPPIDCIADAPPPVDDDFGDFAGVDDQFEATSLPMTPVHAAKLPDIVNTSGIQSSTPPPPDVDLSLTTEENNESTKVDTKSVDDDNHLPTTHAPAPIKLDLNNDLPFVIEAHSPPPLDFEPMDDELPPCDDLDNDDEADEFPADNTGKCDDNISLPSLKFDSLSNMSKSTTPVSDELTKSNHEDSDSLSAFQSIPSGYLEREEIDESPCVENEPAEVIEDSGIPLEGLAITAESDEISNASDDEDFDAFSAAPPQDDVTPAHDKPPDNEPQPETMQETSDFAFEADFSQFSSFEPVAVPPPVASQISANVQLAKRSSLDDLEADDFDDFQDFAVATPVAAERKASLEENTVQAASNTVNDSGDDDDDFGEFNEVVESNTSSIPSSNSGFNLANLNDKLKPILEMMFPFSNATDGDDEKQHSSNDDFKTLTSSSATTISQIDTAKALEYQWSNSEVRHSLIKSLGVDSRNILYGEKWNSSMPRYAANLSFNPLEPMKSDKTTAATGAGSSTSTTSDYRKRSESLATGLTKAEVPAVEFDWNSSGLVNPLDGVKEILHERTIETIHTPQPGESNASPDQQSDSTISSNNTIFDSDRQLRGFIDEEAISATIEFESNANASVTIPAATTTAVTTAAATTTAPAALSNDYIDITSGGGGFLPAVLETDLDTVTATSQVLNHNTTHAAAKYQESSKTDLETELQHSGVVTTSTYAGPLKETHIFTPSKSDNVLTRSNSKTPRTSESKCPIDFDYEIAAAGIIIDETVVKKEYRDLEYNPGFGLKYREETEYNPSPPPPDVDVFGGPPPPTHSYLSPLSEMPPDDFSDLVSVVSAEKPPEAKPSVKASVPISNSFDDEFSEFQSVPAPAPTVVPSTVIPSSLAAESKTSPSHLRKLREAERSSSVSRTGTPVSMSDEMILCPAILLPQAIQMESKPQIEWPEPGINPEEMARIEELFPQPKVSSNKPSPSHSGRSQQQQQNRATPQPGTDDDDWSDFVSVPVAATNHIQSISQQFQRRQASPAKPAPPDPNDEEWSDFVSSAPQPAVNQMRPSAYPQFNSAAWKNANFYNNPMSAYAPPPTSFYYQAAAPQHQHQQLQNPSNNIVPNLTNANNNSASSNNNISINNNSINQYLISNQANQSHHHHQQHQQHIQMMRDFSSSSPMDSGALSAHMASPSIHHQYALQTAAGYGYAGNRGHNLNHGKSSQFGGASSKVAPSISLIPDLGFVAPTHTSFISVPKNSFVTKK